MKIKILSIKLLLHNGRNAQRLYNFGRIMIMKTLTNKKQWYLFKTGQKKIP